MWTGADVTHDAGADLILWFLTNKRFRFQFDAQRLQLSASSTEQLRVQKFGVYEPNTPNLNPSLLQRHSSSLTRSALRLLISWSWAQFAQFAVLTSDKHLKSPGDHAKLGVVPINILRGSLK